MYALFGERTKDLLTLRGRVLVHDNHAEMEWLMPHARIVRVSMKEIHDRSPLPVMWLKDHPAYAGLSWPLKRSEFR